MFCYLNYYYIYTVYVSCVCNFTKNNVSWRCFDVDRKFLITKRASSVQYWRMNSQMFSDSFKSKVTPTAKYSLCSLFCTSYPSTAVSFLLTRDGSFFKNNTVKPSGVIDVPKATCYVRSQENVKTFKQYLLPN